MIVGTKIQSRLNTVRTNTAREWTMGIPVPTRNNNTKEKNLKTQNKVMNRRISIEY